MRSFNTRSFLTLAAIASLYGTTNAHVVLKPDHLLRVPVKCGGLTRVKIQGDKIQDVVVHPSRLKHRVTLHESGQVYVSLKEENKELQLSLMTRKGLTQDLTLICDASQPEAPLILESKEEQDSSIETPKEQTLIVLLAKKALEDSLDNSLRFREVPIRYSSDVLTWEGKKYWEAGGYVISRFETKNKTGKILLLKADDLKQEGDLVVSFDQEILEPGKKAVLIVVTPQNKQVTLPLEGDKNE